MSDEVQRPRAVGPPARRGMLDVVRQRGDAEPPRRMIEVEHAQTVAAQRAGQGLHRGRGAGEAMEKDDPVAVTHGGAPVS